MHFLTSLLSSDVHLLCEHKRYQAQQKYQEVSIDSQFYVFWKTLYKTEIEKNYSDMWLRPCWGQGRENGKKWEGDKKYICLWRILHSFLCKKKRTMIWLVSNWYLTVIWQLFLWYNLSLYGYVRWLSRPGLPNTAPCWYFPTHKLCFNIWVPNKTDTHVQHTYIGKCLISYLSDPKSEAGPTWKPKQMVGTTLNIEAQELTLEK